MSPYGLQAHCTLGDSLEPSSLYAKLMLTLETKFCVKKTEDCSYLNGANLSCITFISFTLNKTLDNRNIKSPICPISHDIGRDILQQELSTSDCICTL